MGWGGPNGEDYDDDDDFMVDVFSLPTPTLDFVRAFVLGLGFTVGVTAAALVILAVRALVLFLL